MPAQISFTDAIGAAVLHNRRPAPAGRFANWTPSSAPVGPTATRQSDGALHVFRFRDDFGASFELRGIPIERVAGVSMVDVADRLIYHLRNGGTCQVETGDVLGSTYATCGLAPGSSPSLALADPRVLEYTLALSLINRAAVPVRMVCYYGG